MVNHLNLESLKNSFRGRLIEPDHQNHDNARKRYNGIIDKHPRVIAGCTDVADVIAAVNFGRENDLLLAIRGGGQNGPGLVSCDDGMVIDLSLMNRTTEDARSGDLFYWPPGHTVKVSDDAEFVLFSPQDEHTRVLDHINRKLDS